MARTHDSRGRWLSARILLALSVLVAAAIALVLPVRALADSGGTEAAFTDVAADTPHEEDVLWLASAGISTGFPDGTFRPYADVARCDMAAFLYRLAGSPDFDPAAAGVGFSDVDEGTPHYREVVWLAARGISRGWDNGDGTAEFRPYAYVARCDMAAFLYRLAGSPDFEPGAGDLAYFSDVDESTPHYKEVLWLAHEGVSQGWTEADGSHAFRNYATVARCDMAAFMHRMVINGIVAAPEAAAVPLSDAYATLYSDGELVIARTAATDVGREVVARGRGSDVFSSMERSPASDGYSSDMGQQCADNTVKVTSRCKIVVTDADNMLFYDWDKLTDISGLAQWDVSKVNDLSMLFDGCTSLSDLSPLAGWDVSSVTDMGGLFEFCRSIADLSPLAGWDVSNVTTFNSMFRYCGDSNGDNDVTLDLSGISGWDVSHVTDMSLMFQCCTSLANLEPLAAWNTASLENMEGMFQEDPPSWNMPYRLTSLAGLEKWDVTHVTNATRLFEYCDKLVDISALKDWKLTSASSFANMFDGCSSLKSLEPLASWEVASVTDMQSMFADCSSLTSAEGLRNWDVSHVVSMGGYSSEGGTAFERYTYNRGMLSGCSSLADISALSTWNTASLEDMRGLFYGCSSLSDLTPLAGWDLSKVTDLTYTFANCSSLTNLSGIGNWKVSGVTGMVGTFSGCTSLSDISALSSWDVSNVSRGGGDDAVLPPDKRKADKSTNDLTADDLGYGMYYLFAGCSSLCEISPLKGWDVSQVQGMRGLFKNCAIVDLTPLSGWNVANVINMDSMFSSCRNLTGVSALSGWKVDKVTDASGMFASCSSLVDVSGLSGWNVSNMRDVSEMFAYTAQNSYTVDYSSLNPWQLPANANTRDMFQRLGSWQTATYPTWYTAA